MYEFEGIPQTQAIVRISRYFVRMQFLYRGMVNLSWVCQNCMFNVCENPLAVFGLPILINQAHKLIMNIAL